MRKDPPKKDLMAPSSEVEDRLKHVEEISKTCQRLLILLLTTSFYFCLVVFTTKDVQLLSDSRQYHLPIIGTEISIVNLFVIGPVLLLALYFYCHLRLQRLWLEVGELPTNFDQTPLYHKITPSLWNYVVCRYRTFKGGKPPLVSVHNFVAIALTWWMVPLTISSFWIRYLPRHDMRVTIWHVLLTIGSIIWGVWSYRLMRKTLKQENALPFTRRVQRLLQRPLWVNSAILICGVFLTLVSAGAIYGIPDSRPGRMPDSKPNFFRTIVPRILMPNSPFPFADLRYAEFSIKPTVWPGKDIDLIQGARLSNRDLRYADAQRVFLVNATLDGVDFFGANLNGAQLRKATGSGSDFSEAFLEGADLREVDFRSVGFERANLKNANFEGARLLGARFQNAALFQANFCGADLRLAEFQEADLGGVELSNAVLGQANLRKATLSKRHALGMKAVTVTLDGTHMDRAILIETDLRGVDLTKAIGITQEQIDVACVDETTKLPSNITMQTRCKQPPKGIQGMGIVGRGPKGEENTPFTMYIGPSHPNEPVPHCESSP